MFRQFDWTCLDCHVCITALVDVPHGNDAPAMAFWSDLEMISCPICGGVAGAKRNRVNQVAEYLADKPFSPMVGGGTFDTVGKKPLPPLPKFRGQTGHEFDEHRRSAEFAEAKKERKARKQENAAKQERAHAIRSGENIDVRHHPLAGDPAGGVMQ